MKNIILFIAIVFSCSLMGQIAKVLPYNPPIYKETNHFEIHDSYNVNEFGDSIKVPKELIQELANYLAKDKPNSTNTITDPLDLSHVRTAGQFALSIPWGGLGRQLLVQMQNSPYDEDYLNKGLRVNPVFFAEIQLNQFGDQIIVFRKK